MLKKAGILVGVAAAGVLALTPFAFAWDDEQPPAEVHHTSIQDGNLTNDCEFDQVGPDVTQVLEGGSSVADVGGLVTGAVAPITTQTQALNCTNIGISDVIDVDSNNDDTTVTESETEDSFNTEG